MTRYRVPTDSGHFASTNALIIWCVTGLLFVLVSWAVAGADFRGTLLGDAALAVFVAGMVMGALLGAWFRMRGRRRGGN